MEWRLFKDRVGFAIGTGRCATKFLAHVIGHNKAHASSHERNQLNETFHKYCKWYHLPVDHEGFLSTKGIEITRDLESHRFSFEASPFLSLSVCELYERFGARFVLLVRRPERVINPLIHKGWYQEPVARSNTEHAVGYQSNVRLHHGFGRILPSGKKFQEWQDMTQVGKLAWYWNALNEAVIDQFKSIPRSHWMIVKVEELTLDRCREIANFFGISLNMDERAFNRILKSGKNTIWDIRTTAAWDAQELAEFEREVEPMARYLGYEYLAKGLELQEVQRPKMHRYIMHKIMNKMSKKVMVLKRS